MNNIWPSILCFGEVLWDHLPSGPVPGGAPMNVAVGLRAFGLRSGMITAVGGDGPGERLTGMLRDRGVDTSLVQTSSEACTGEVHVRLDASGVPSYDIVSPSAWDFITADERMDGAVREADAFVFGTLACRHESSRTTLLRLLDLSRYAVLDVNLRAPHFSLPFVESLLRKADFIKLNEEELSILSPSEGHAGLHERMMHLASRSGAEAVCVTRGEHGAVLYYIGTIHEHPGFRVTVADTVGAGDGFLAGFLFRWLNGATPSEALAFGCAAGAVIASHPGANPEISVRDIDAILHPDAPLNDPPSSPAE